MKLIIGLGNPGAKYSGTRHNIGFEVVSYLAQAPGCSSARMKFSSLIVEMKHNDETVLLVQPQTFMNLSGRSVREILDFHKLTPVDLLVVSDDINLPLGKLRMRTSGSHGGQNGLRNIQECLGTDQYPRLRLGVGAPATGEAVDYVLGRFKPGEKAAVEEAIAKAADAAIVWLKRGPEAAMNMANSGVSHQGSGGSEEKKKLTPVKIVKKRTPDTDPPSGVAGPASLTPDP